MNNNAGRSCPIRYQYGPARIAEAPATPCDVLYVVGGLYGGINFVLRYVAQGHHALQEGQQPSTRTHPAFEV